jgi:phosphoribosylformimino-5-aminoimidazole carboxamide ribotide isomerase
VSPLTLFPAIDLKDGRCVRLFKGRFNEATVYGDDPVAMAQRWVNEGANYLHLVNLDGSIGLKNANLAAIRNIVKSVPVKLQLGGGVRTLEDMKAWLDLGVDRLILGTVICEDPKLVAKAASLFPTRLAASLDSVGERLKIRGWLEDGGQDVLTAASRLKDLGVSVVIHTDVDRDGAQSGPNLELAAKVAQAADLPTIVAGGVSGLKDLLALRDLQAPNIIGAITGRAIYEGTLDLAAGLKIFNESPASL